MHLYSMLDNGEVVLTINADNAVEAQNVLSALGMLGANHAIRRASALEVQAWMSSATQPRDRNRLRRLHKKTPAASRGEVNHQNSIGDCVTAATSF